MLMLLCWVSTWACSSESVVPSHTSKFLRREEPFLPRAPIVPQGWAGTLILYFRRLRCP